LAREYVAVLKALPADKLGARKDEAKQVLGALEFLSNHDILPADFAPKIELEQLVKTTDIPRQDRGGRTVFLRGELDAWASQRILGLPPKSLAAYHQKSTVGTRAILSQEALLPDLLQSNFIAAAMTSKTKKSVIRDLVDLAGSTGRVMDPADLLASVEAREQLCRPWAHAEPPWQGAATSSSRRTTTASRARRAAASTTGSSARRPWPAAAWRRRSRSILSYSFPLLDFSCRQISFLPSAAQLGRLGQTCVQVLVEKKMHVIAPKGPRSVSASIGGAVYCPSLASAEDLDVLDKADWHIVSRRSTWVRFRRRGNER